MEVNALLGRVHDRLLGANKSRKGRGPKRGGPHRGTLDRNKLLVWEGELSEVIDDA